MKNNRTSFALRQLRGDLSRGATWIAIGGTGLVLALAGAFGTGDNLRPLPLAIYWIVVVALTYAAGSFASLHVTALARSWPLVPRILAMGLAAGAAVSVVVIGINMAVFGPIFTGPAEWLSFLATVFSVALVITAVIDQVVLTSSNATTSATAPAAILDRLPLDKRGALVALTVEDHYVRVRTTRGEELVLMRLGDAIREAGDGGLQVHRSHWVAKDQIASARRDGDRAILTLTHGGEIPASRRYIPDLKEAGLLPKGGRNG